MQVSGITDRGCVRETNEDSILLEQSLYVVADGMGGHLAGEIASSEALLSIKNFLSKEKCTCDMETFLVQAIEKANSHVFGMSQGKDEYKGMGTTITLVKVVDEQLYYAHIGDSRLYTFIDNQLTQITNDHSLVAQMVADGEITEKEAISHPKKNIITKAVGTSEKVEPDTGVITVHKGDLILVCSDGLTNMLSNDQIVDILKLYAKDIDKMVQVLIASANEAGGKDNISAICLQF